LARVQVVVFWVMTQCRDVARYPRFGNLAASIFSTRRHDPDRYLKLHRESLKSHIRRHTVHWRGMKRGSLQCTCAMDPQKAPPYIVSNTIHRNSAYKEP